MENEVEVLPAKDLIARFRESHHTVARMFAAGMTPEAIRRQTGHTARRLALMTYDPSFQELVAYYRNKFNAKFEAEVEDYATLAIGNMMAAEIQLSDKLAAAEESGEFLPTRELLAITSDRADRFGYSKHTVVRHEHDFAALMDKAIARSRKVLSDPKVVEGQVLASLPPPQQTPMPVLGDSQSPREVASARPPSSSASTPAGGGRPSFSEVLIKRRKVA